MEIIPTAGAKLPDSCQTRAASIASAAIFPSHRRFNGIEVWLAISRLTAGLLCIIKLFMRARITATLQLVLLFPALLFMSSLILRQLQPQQYEPAHSAQQVVLWYAARMWSLWILLLALPMAVLVTGCATLLRGWKRDTALTSAARQLLAVIRAQFAMLVVAAATLTAGGILAIVVLHMLAN